jgi:hypothetical protein
MEVNRVQKEVLNYCSQAKNNYLLDKLEVRSKRGDSVVS